MTAEVYHNADAMQPLYVDTSIEYDLNMAMFPGWDDLTTRYQPTLMLHYPYGPCYCAPYMYPQTTGASYEDSYYGPCYCDYCIYPQTTASTSGAIYYPIAVNSPSTNGELDGNNNNIDDVIDSLITTSTVTPPLTSLPILSLSDDLEDITCARDCDLDSTEKEAPVFEDRHEDDVTITRKRKYSWIEENTHLRQKRQRCYSDDILNIFTSILCCKDDDSTGENKKDLCRGS